jgi:hypothetical protein
VAPHLATAPLAASRSPVRRRPRRHSRSIALADGAEAPPAPSRQIPRGPSRSRVRGLGCGRSQRRGVAVFSAEGARARRCSKAPTADLRCAAGWRCSPPARRWSGGAEVPVAAPAHALHGASTLLSCPIARGPGPLLHARSRLARLWAVSAPCHRAPCAPRRATTSPRASARGSSARSARESPDEHADHHRGPPVGLSSTSMPGSSILFADRSKAWLARAPSSGRAAASARGASRLDAEAGAQHRRPRAARSPRPRGRQADAWSVAAACRGQAARAQQPRPPWLRRPRLPRRRREPLVLPPKAALRRNLSRASAGPWRGRDGQHVALRGPVWLSAAPARPAGRHVHR